MHTLPKDFFEDIEKVTAQQFSKSPQTFIRNLDPKICVQNIILANADVGSGKEPVLILTERAHGNRHHGELVLPGGKVDGDISKQSEGIRKFIEKEGGRESFEEIRFSTKDADRAGYIPIDKTYFKPMLSINMFATVVDGYDLNKLKPQVSEVKNIYALPIKNLFDTAVEYQTRLYDRAEPKNGLQIEGGNVYRLNDSKKKPLLASELIIVEDDIIRLRGNKLVAVAGSQELQSNDRLTMREGGMVLHALQNYIGKGYTEINARMQQAFNESKLAQIERVEIIQQRGRSTI